MFSKRKKQGRIFLSYRRSDTQGYAGRLSDSLETYFGGNRVFRDIEDIEGGAEFAKDIKTQITTADAIIILIGPTWLSTTDNDGNRRIDNPNDWVAQEIIMAIEQGVRVFPVLIDGTPFPRKNELPEKLMPILNYNAITISDKNWDAEVLRLGKIISFDVRTTSERILFQAQILIYALLGASLIFSASYIYNSVSREAKIDFKNEGIIMLEAAATPFYVIVITLIILSLILKLVAEDKRKYIVYSLITGVVGSAYFFFGLYFVEDSNEMIEEVNESNFVFLGSIIISALMYLFLGLSGFKPK